MIVINTSFFCDVLCLLIISYFHLSLFTLKRGRRRNPIFFFYLYIYIYILYKTYETKKKKKNFIKGRKDNGNRLERQIIIYYNYLFKNIYFPSRNKHTKSQ